MLEARATGIDIAYPKHKIEKGKKGKHLKRIELAEPEWEFVQRDLTQPNVIDPVQFLDNTFDAVHCKDFIGNSDIDDPRRDCPEIMRIFVHEEQRYYEILEGIRNAAIRVLKENGIFILSDPTNVETKINGRLRRRNI